MENKLRMTKSITKADSKGKILKNFFSMASISGGVEAHVNYINEQLLTTEGIAKGEFNSYGTVSLIDETEGRIIKSWHIGNDFNRLDHFDFQDELKKRNEKDLWQIAQMELLTA